MFRQVKVPRRRFQYQAPQTFSREIDSLKKEGVQIKNEESPLQEEIWSRPEETIEITNNITQVVSGSAGFDILVASASSTTNLYTATTADSSSTVYFYAQALSTNPQTLLLSITGSNTSGNSVVRLRPGDMTYMPLNADAAGVAVNCINASTSSANVYTFYGQRS